MRPNILYKIGLVSRFMEEPKPIHVNTKKVLRYIKGIITHDPLYPFSNDFLLIDYSDDD